MHKPKNISSTKYLKYFLVLASTKVLFDLLQNNKHETLSLMFIIHS